MDHVIRFPARLDFAGGNEVARELYNLPPAARYILDLSKMGWVEPLPMLQVSSAVRRAVETKPEARFKARGHVNNSYPAFMGFFRELGLRAGPPEGQVANHDNYLPINVLDFETLRQEATSRSVAIGRLIERHAGSMATTLLRTNYGELWETLRYALREVLRNVVEHSQSDYAYYCGQYWPGSGKVEVAILDDGIGIAQSLRSNPYLRIGSDLEAVKLGVLPGISGKAYKGARVDEKDEWSNSGFGLFVVSELCRRGGSLTVLSGRGGLHLLANKREAIETHHEGTALRLIIHTENLRSIAAAVELIVAKGEKIARELLKLEAVEASVASKLASLD